MLRPATRPPAGPTPLLSLAVAGLLFCATAAGAAPPKIYKWVDQNGIAHYTTDPDRIPESLRDRILSTGRVAEPEPEPAPAPQPAAPPSETASTPAPPPPESTPEPAPPPPESTSEAAPAPREPIAVPTPETARSGEAWFQRDATPRVDTAAILAAGEATPEQLEALAAEQEALDARIAEVEAEIRRDENFLKGLISDPDLDSDVPLFDRPEFLEVSRRLPELQARLQELRDERAKLELP
jgi:hypothetical protein